MNRSIAPLDAFIESFSVQYAEAIQDLVEESKNEAFADAKRILRKELIKRRLSQSSSVTKQASPPTPLKTGNDTNTLNAGSMVHSLYLRINEELGAIRAQLERNEHLIDALNASQHQNKHPVCE